MKKGNCEKVFPWVGAYVFFKKEMKGDEFVRCPVEVILIDTPARVFRVNSETVTLKVPYLNKCDCFTVVISLEKLGFLKPTEETIILVNLFRKRPLDKLVEDLGEMPVGKPSVESGSFREVQRDVCEGVNEIPHSLRDAVLARAGEEVCGEPHDPNLNDSEICRWIVMARIPPKLQK